MVISVKKGESLGGKKEENVLCKFGFSFVVAIFIYLYIDRDSLFLPVFTFRL